LRQKLLIFITLLLFNTIFFDNLVVAYFMGHPVQGKRCHFICIFIHKWMHVMLSFVLIS